MTTFRIRNGVFVLCYLAWTVHGRRPPNAWMLPTPRSTIASIHHNKHSRSLLSRGGGGYHEDWYEQATASQQRSDSVAADHSSDEDDYYGDDRRQTSRRRNSTIDSSSVATLLHKLQHGDRQIGILLLGSGAAITMLGISLFFNKTLLRLGNLLFMGGVPVSIGPSRTMGYFMKPEKLRATACLALGIFLVFVGSPMFGILFELFGLLNLFGNMFPFVWAIAKNLPVMGPMLKSFSGEGGGKKQRPKQSKQSSYDEPQYNDDDDYYGRDDYQQYQEPYGDDGWGNQQGGGGYY